MTIYAQICIYVYIRIWRDNIIYILTINIFCRIDVKKLLDKFCDYNLHILGPNAFYPFHWKQWECLFKETKRTKSSHDEKIEPHLPVSNEDPMMTNSTYAVHTWYDLYRRMQKVKDISSKSPYIKLSQTHCPTTYHSQMKSLSWSYLTKGDFLWCRISLPWNTVNMNLCKNHDPFVKLKINVIWIPSKYGTTKDRSL